MKLVFVHGRAQQGKDPAALKREWMDALGIGLRASGLSLPAAADGVSLPYYGDRLFSLTERLDEVERDMVAKGGPVSDPMLQFEAAAMLEMAAAAGIPEEAAAAQGGGAAAKGPQNWGWVLAAVRALDGWNGGLSARALSLLLRDVFVYTTRRGVADAVDEVVREALTEEPTVVVAHSLGTVVAYNVLRNEPRPLGVPLLVTLGSPLGISAVRRQLVPLKAPKAAAWFNAFDPHDIVALNPLDTDHFAISPPIENKCDVDNSTDNRHGISGYLSDPVVARRIHDALTGR